MGVDLFVGGQPGTIRGDHDDLVGKRMFTAVHRPRFIYGDIAAIDGYLDSGAFSDPPQNRLEPDEALSRQLAWENKAGDKWSYSWQAQGIVSYDLLIDETWVNGQRHKRRWSIGQADGAVEETIRAAKYLATQRRWLAPRRLILSCQGVDAIQYRECTQEILNLARPGDIIGLGGWCILGRRTTLLPEFWKTIRAIFPLVAARGIRDVHIFGVLYGPALGGMLWLADQYGLAVSTDSSAPIRSAACTSTRTRKKAGVRVMDGDWRDNVRWWVNYLGGLRSSEFYKEPPDLALGRQLSLI